MKILVCGGAGYIGSHVVKMATEAGHNIAVVDNLSTGHRESVEGHEFHLGDIGDKTFISNVLSNGDFDLVMHLCAYSLVGESISNPLKYFQNNVCQTLTLFQSMLETGVKNLVFSSTAAVYGIPSAEKIDENHPRQPINPYGQSKLVVENVLKDFSDAYGFNSVSLRYFNAAGADPSGIIGEKHIPETHLIPNILKSIDPKNNVSLEVYGTDYPTADGTCIRDYIHVNDLATAHLHAGLYLEKNSGCHAFNLGIGKGFSVLDVIQSAESITGLSIQYTEKDRRAGDPAVLVANADLARQTLNWEPAFTEINQIIETAWKWHKNGEQFNQGK